jgi:hypothetical protein
MRLNGALASAGGSTMLQREGWLATGVFIIVMPATVGCDGRLAALADEA